MRVHQGPLLPLLLCLAAGGSVRSRPGRSNPVVDHILVEKAASTTILLTARPGDELRWIQLGDEARRFADSLTAWYGPCSRDTLWVFDAAGLVDRDSVAENFIFLRQRPVPSTRWQERRLCLLLAEQWLGSADDDSSGWVALGLASHAVSRYLDAAYGPTNLLDLPFSSSLLAGLGDDYLKRVLYYVAASNRLLPELPSLAGDSSLVLAELRQAQAGLFVRMLREQAGHEVFDRAVRLYRESGDADVRKGDSFIRALSVESQRDFCLMFRGWQQAGAFCDYAVTGVKTRGNEVEVGLRRAGTVSMSFELELRFAEGTVARHLVDSLVAGQPVRFPTAGRLKQVVLDPDRKLLEPDRWNNYWPRRVEVQPIFALPSLEAYQFFYGPYAWYDNYHGVQLGAWAQGRQFIASGPLHGRHMWTLSETYSTRINDWHTGASYITPLDFISRRLRVSFLGDYSLTAAGVRLSLLQEFGKAFGTPNGLVDFGYRFFDLRDLIGRDTLAWQEARTGEVRLRLIHNYGTGPVSGSQQVYLGRGLSAFGGEGRYRYWKASMEEACEVKLTRRCLLRLRIFAGAIQGSIPAQDQFYLSGGLQPTSSEPVSWGLKGMSSAQEHWHYDNDVNCRGFSGEYRHGEFAYGANCYVGVLPFVLPFFDFGNVAESLDAPGFGRPLMDAGLRLKLGPLYADFPFWRYSDAAGHEFAFRWMLGLKLEL